MLQGRCPLTRELEDGLRDHLHAGSVVLFPTGWSAGFGAVTGLVRPDDHVLIDELAQAAEADAMIRWWETQLENTVIRAPFTGVVVKKMAEVGESVAPIPPGVNISTASGAIVALASEKGRAILFDSEEVPVLAGPVERQSVVRHQRPRLRRQCRQHRLQIAGRSNRPRNRLASGTCPASCIAAGPT